MTFNTTDNATTLERYVSDLGQRVSQIRLSRDITQADLAKEAGVSEKSVKRLEAGDNVSLDTFLRVLKALRLANALINALPDPDVRPIERVKLRGRERQRASGLRRKPVKKKWEWGTAEK